MKKLFLMFLLGSVMVMGCNKILDQNPLSSLAATTAFTTGPSITAGIQGIYNTFQNSSYYGTDYTLLCDLEADNLDHTGSYPTYEQVKNRAITPDNTNTTGVWNEIYAGINRCNTIIAAASTITTGGYDSVPSIAEAKFLRAFMYFDLMRYFGGTPSGYIDPNGEGVPLVLAPTFSAVEAAPHVRSSAGAVFAQILSDLGIAIANLPSSNNFGQANTNAAIALKARVELYIGQYDAAAADAETLISQLGPMNATGGLDPSYSDQYVSKNVQPESIFELNFSNVDQNGLFFYYYGRDEVATSPSLQAAYQPADIRLPVNYFSFDGTVGTSKYELADGSNDIMLIRLSEMYLTHAEGVMRGNSPNLATAIGDINVVRGRAQETLDTTTSSTQLLADILEENRLEFPHECHRWFDLRRLGLAASTFGITDTTKVLWPIPQAEVLTSGGVITQNPNY
jgi:hypothetical protein